jgi:hypothetical protein
MSVPMTGMETMLQGVAVFTFVYTVVWTVASQSMYKKMQNKFAAGIISGITVGPLIICIPITMYFIYAYSVMFYRKLTETENPQLS